MAAIDIKSLSVEERLRLLDEIWESLDEAPAADVLTPDQCAELDRRLAEFERERSAGQIQGVPLDEALDELLDGND